MRILLKSHTKPERPSEPLHNSLTLNSHNAQAHSHVNLRTRSLKVEIHFMTNSAAGYDQRISLYDPRNSLYDRTHIFDEGEKIVVGSVLNNAGARWGERVDGSSGNYFQVKVEGIV